MRTNEITLCAATEMSKNNDFYPAFAETENRKTKQNMVETLRLSVLDRIEFDRIKERSKDFRKLCIEEIIESKGIARKKPGNNKTGMENTGLKFPLYTFKD
jgi:hypothetical protein